MTLPAPGESEPSIDITALSYGPYGIGRLNGKAIMIPHTAPGDRVVARVVDSQKHYAIGAMVRIIHPSALRQTPPCPYVGRCGGCSWQHLRYDTQLRAKQQSVEDALRRIGKLDGFEIRPIIPALDPYRYRRRIRLQATNAKRLGFYGAASHDLVEIDSCAIANDRLNSTIGPLRRWLAEINSVIEHLEIIAGDGPDELVVVARSHSRLAPGDEPSCAGLIDGRDLIRGLIVLEARERKTWGEPWITVKLTDALTVTLDADLFTQVNAVGNRQMISRLLAVGDFRVDDQVLELYSGAGNFTLPMATRVEKIVAVEGRRQAVANGKLNAEKYRLDNIDWQCAAVPQAVARLKRQRRKFSKIVLDPPRAGAKGVTGELAALGAEMICYLSCNPTTMARDLAALAARGHKLRLVQPIDLFPHTFHVESLAVMIR
jgi:23S rRNA (uracil1939-C5)-methyltransferase